MSRLPASGTERALARASPNSLRAQRLQAACKRSAFAQTASERNALPSTSFRAPRLAFKQLRSAARPFSKHFRAPQIRSPTASSPQNRRALKVPNYELCLKTSLEPLQSGTWHPP